MGSKWIFFPEFLEEYQVSWHPREGCLRCSCLHLNPPTTSVRPSFEAQAIMLAATAAAVITFRVSRRPLEMYCGHPRLCVWRTDTQTVFVCLSAAACLHYCTDSDVTWRSGKGCPLVVHYWADLQSVHGLRCYGNITRTLVTRLSPFRDMTTSIDRHRASTSTRWHFAFGPTFDF